MRIALCVNQWRSFVRGVLARLEHRLVILLVALRMLEEGAGREGEKLADTAAFEDGLC